MMTNNEGLQVAMQQSAWDMNCNPDVFLKDYNEPINSDKKIVDSKLDFTYDFNHERRPTYGKETTHTGGESPTRA